jgi:proteic killer suppression protein
MIKSFKHRGLEAYFTQNTIKKIAPDLIPRIKRILDRLDGSISIQDMNIPSFGLHQLKGNRKETWSVKVSGNWRITFQFIEPHAYDVNLEDYH